MKSSLYITITVFALLFNSCSLLDDDGGITPPGFLDARGVFIVNEGNFMAGNGSLSFYSFDSSKIYNDIFSEANSRPLGDVPNSMVIRNGKVYVVVNNSGKIEVCDARTIKSAGSLSGLDSPRNLLVASGEKAYVTSLFSDSITIINLGTKTVTGSIKTRRSTEAAALVSDKAYFSCWYSGNEVLVVNTLNDKLLDSIEVGREPESMVVDKYGKLWVLCSGSYAGDDLPELVSINTVTDQVDRKYTFPSKDQHPSSLRINTTGDTLYFINGGIFRMPVSDDSLPAEAITEPEGRIFYKLAVLSPGKGFLATNVVDYQQRGYLLFINSCGQVTDSVRTGIIPGALCFN
jgi:YVTN family beta-propeller protein